MSAPRARRSRPSRSSIRAIPRSTAARSPLASLPHASNRPSPDAGGPSCARAPVRRCRRPFRQPVRRGPERRALAAQLRSRSSVCWPIAGRQRASPPHRRRAAGLLHRLHDGGACRDLSALASVAIGIGQGPKTHLYAGDSFFSDRAISVMRCPYSRAAVIGSPDSVFAGTTTIPAQAAAA